MATATRGAAREGSLGRALAAAQAAIRAALDGAEIVPVKRGTHRQVFRLEGPGGTYYLKHSSRTPGWRGWLRRWRPTAAEREFQNAERMRAAGVPTARIEAWLTGPDGASLLLSRALIGYTSLERWVAERWPQLAPRVRALARRRLTRALAEWLARAHKAGIDHGDLHAGNVLFAAEQAESAAFGSAGLEIAVIDVPSVRVHPMHRQATRRALAAVAAAFQEGSSPAVRGWFVARYSQFRSEAAAWLREDIARIAADALKRQRAIAARRDHRPWRDNREFYSLRTEQGTAFAVRDLAAAELARWLADPLRPLREQGYAPLKLSRSSQVIKGEWADAEDSIRPVVFKRLAARDLLKGQWWARRRACRNWWLGHALRTRGIAAPRPLALLLPRRGCAALLMVEWVPGSVNLHLYAWELARRAPTERQRFAKATAEALGRLVGRMHHWQVAHRDLKGCNLLVRETRGRVEAPPVEAAPVEAVSVEAALVEAAHVEASLVDWDGVEICRHLSRATRMANLARLAASLEMHPGMTASLRLRFLKSYLQETGVAHELPWWWQQLGRATQRLTHRRARRHAAEG